MADAGAAASSHSMLGLLLRVKARAAWNRTRQAVNEAPVRLSAAVILIALIWFGLYWLFWLVFKQFERTPLEATVAIPLVFNFFFVAMLVMLTFSNAIIAYGSLFGKAESTYLLSSPLTPLDVVTLKYLESLVMASWSLILLGLPLMMAMAERTEQPVFYVLFIAFFLAFIPIPGALGMLLAWAVARFLPRRVIRVAAAVAGILVAGLIVWGMRSLRLGNSPVEVWLRSFLGRMSIVESAFLPNNWVARGIDHALHDQFSQSVLYLGVTVANALFVSWLVVMIVSKYFDGAHDRASTGHDEGKRPASQASGGPAGLVFFYLPPPLRLIAAKDLRTFFRDPLQWAQLAILFGLMVLYLTNMPTLRLQFSGSGWFLIIPFLNLCAISLILATFTCRFVFPLVSLEGRQLWLIGLLPMPRGHILLAKFAFAMTVTLLVAVSAMGLATVMLELDTVWAFIHVFVTVAICFGLCGFAVGIGARLPMFNQTNVARIANGLGGTTNLLASLALVAAVLAGVGVATWRSRGLPSDALPDGMSLAICGSAALVSIAAGLTALWVGARHFNRIEV
ncbi:MAG: hypothetical protein WBE26_00890 [Phycisphaerae bacterium]